MIIFKESKQNWGKIINTFLCILCDNLKLLRKRIRIFNNFLCQIQSADSHIRWLNMYAGVIKHRYLNDILSKMVSDLVLLGDLYKSIKERIGRNKINIEVKFSEHTHFLIDDLLFIVGIVTHVYVIFYKWGPNLFVFTSN